MYFHKAQEKPQRWGNFQDIQYAIRVNSAKIYDCDPDSNVLVMPLFWGLPPLDYSGFNNHGKNYGSVYKDRRQEFDGDNDYINVNHHNSIDFADEDFSISLWFKTDSIKGNNYFFTKNYGGVGVKWYGVNLYVAELKIIFFVDDGTTNSKVETTNDYNDGFWHLATFVRNTVTNKIIAYIDGQFNAEVVDGSGSVANTGNLVIGSRSDFSAIRFYDGFIADIRISNVAPTANQIALFYDRPWDLYKPVSRPIYSIPASPSLYIPQIIIF